MQDFIAACLTVWEIVGGPQKFGVLQPQSLGIGIVPDSREMSLSNTPLPYTLVVTIPNLVGLGQTAWV